MIGNGGYVGGIAGYIQDLSITNCYNAGSVAGVNNIGEIVGYLNSSQLTDSYNTGSVLSSNISVGGVVGRAYNSQATNCYNTASVSGSNYVGGVVGYVSCSNSGTASISSCYTTEEIIRSSGSYAYFGGVVGYIENNTTYPSQHVSISWCYYNIETIGSIVMDAIGSGNGYQVYGLTTAQMQGLQSNNYMYLSSTVWNFAEGEYPTLKYVATAQN